MNIGELGANKTLFQIAAQRSYFPAVNSTNVSPEDDDDGFQQSQESGKLKDIVSEYDLSNISGSDLTKMGDELYRKNLITAEEKQTFSTAADCPLTKMPVQQGVEGNSATQSDAENQENVKLDYPTQWKDFKASLGADVGQENKDVAASADKVLNLFEKIGFYSESQKTD